MGATDRVVAEEVADEAQDPLGLVHPLELHALVVQLPRAEAHLAPRRLALLCQGHIS